MSQGVTLSEAEEKRERPPGFFPQLYENVCKKLSTEDYETLQKLRDDTAEFIKYVFVDFSRFLYFSLHCMARLLNDCGTYISFSAAHECIFLEYIG